MIDYNVARLGDDGLDLIGQHMVGLDTISDIKGPLEDYSVEPIDQHMSIQDMFRLLSRHGCVDLSLQMEPDQNGAVLVSGGGFGDIWRGQLSDGTRVAIKTWREALITKGDYKTLKQAVREIHVWSKMKHVNVHQLMGVVIFKGQSIGMVSEWMDNGNVHEYVRKNPHADRFKLAGFANPG
ncbi:unnamed protein product [Rhizoctonia solani]|uniref:Protein kinase domain-containing protein n=1 Tax=Rhizoctonia solani TaxID=456999 RepID=A0A8H3AAS4_9AGAM|nr:unnamed protein product [Rhizoctonia solani]